jgi:hypothetical protein
MHWLWILWYGYAWPSLKGNGPEALIQTVVYFVIAVIFIPRFRKFLRGELGHLHNKLDHIIRHHPDIPPFTEGKP